MSFDLTMHMDGVIRVYKVLCLQNHLCTILVILPSTNNECV